MDYEELVQKNKAGEISDLEFQLAQDELAPAYKESMKESLQEINDEKARKWLLKNENGKLYGHGDKW